MKRIICILFLVMLSVAAVAQTKGDKCVGFCIALSADATRASSGAKSGSTVLTSQTEFDYFVVDNFRIGAAIGFGLTRTLQNASFSARDRTATLFVNPNIAYYLPLGEHGYYTPELGMAFNMVSYINDVGVSQANGVSLYLNVISFEFPVTDAFSIGINAGQLGITNFKDLGVTQLQCNLNSGSLAIRYYL